VHEGWLAFGFGFSMRKKREHPVADETVGFKAVGGGFALSPRAMR